jgi:hypothetical protein
MVAFVSLTTLKDMYGFDLNTDQAYILPNIYKCQKFVIKPLLGNIEYAAIENYVIQKETSGATTDLRFETMLDYIADIIAYYVRAEIVFNTAYKMKNAANNPDGDRFDELIKISKKYQNDSEGFTKLFKDWMCENGMVKGEKYVFRSSIFLGDTKMYNKKSATSIEDNYTNIYDEDSQYYKYTNNR